MTQVAFVVNRSRVRDVPQFAERCGAAAAAAGLRSSFLATSIDDHGAGLARGAVRAGARLVVAVGGDGTVRACCEALAGTDVPLAIVPRGTANLAARALRLPAGLAAALAVGFGEHERRIDLAEADGMTFAAMAGLGLDAAVVGATPGLLKSRAGWLAYALSGVRHLAGRPASFSVRLDGGEPLIRSARSVVVGNVGLLPGGFVLLPAARPDDGLLDVGILAPSGPADWARVGYRVLAGGGPDDALIERYQARRVEIRAGEPLPREVDGEIIPPARLLSVAVCRAALTVRVPADARG